MSHQAIVVENVSKQFRIGTRRGPGYERLSELLTSLPRALAQKAWQRSRASFRSRHNHHGANEFWALRDVSFEVRSGEVLGIVGRNGAGKSTLLKILSRITEPTSGRFGIRGRVASLLEVGTGFHPELTGRENIAVAGVTLGMTRAEIKKRFEEIVAFSGVESFLDTPLKHYSSGMQVRLGFAVASHLECEILIVDEVLSVGDAAFKSQSQAKVKKVAKDGRTVIMVTHNQASLLESCTKAIHLEEGRLKRHGDPSDVVSSYMQNLTSTHLRSITYDVLAGQSMAIMFGELLHPTGQLDISDEIEFSLDINTYSSVPNAYLAITVHDSFGGLVYWSSDIDTERFATQPKGRRRVVCKIPAHTLLPGSYLADFAICTTDRREIQYTPSRQVSFMISDGTSRLASYGIKRPGVCAAVAEWNCHVV